jgi:MATE family multidrug resistance protein
MRQVNPFDRPPSGGAGSGIHAELRATLALAAPLSAANIAMIAMAVTNTVMVARLGTIPLAAAGLGSMFYFTFGIVLQGILFAVAPIAAHAVGAGDRRVAGRAAGAGLVLALLFSPPFVIALASLHWVLQRLGYNAALAAEISSYLQALAWGGPAFLGSAVLRSLLAAVSHARAVMAVLLVGVVSNAVLSWSMIFGHLGAPAMGVVGSGYASAINQWLMLAGLALCTRVLPECAGLHLLRGAFAASRTQMAEILRLGLPMGAIRGIESGVFLATGVLMGLFGAAALGAHQLVLNCASVSFMVPLGLSQAATVRVAYEIGAGRPREANRAGFVALALGVLFMSAAALVFWTMPLAIIGVYRPQRSRQPRVGTDRAPADGDCRDLPGVRRHPDDRGGGPARLQGHLDSAAARHFRLLGSGVCRRLAPGLSTWLRRRRSMVGPCPRARNGCPVADPAAASVGNADRAVRQHRCSAIIRDHPIGFTGCLLSLAEDATAAHRNVTDHSTGRLVDDAQRCALQCPGRI